jgi:dTDP-glucose pyrophosphorylase
MAGAGSRFADEGYKLSKPLIPVSGEPMIIQAVRSLPVGETYTFIIRKEHAGSISGLLQQHYPNCKIIELDYLTEGQASTCLLAKEYINPDLPLIIGACDNGMTYDNTQLNALMNNPEIDAAIFTFRNNPTVKRNPKMYGWVKTNAENAVEVKCKQPISEAPMHDHAVVGTFYFRKASYCMDAIERMIEKNIRINHEFYLDTAMNELIEIGQHVKVFEIDKYICWGTPNDLRTYEYWERYFNSTKND